MKIEMGESLFYSWLRHVKECQIVQTNWKTSSKWEFMNSTEIEDMLQELDVYIEESYGGKVFKKNSSLNQIIQQGECDALGIHIENGSPFYYAVDVAFHESGLNYGSKEETILKILSKCIRTIFCLYGFFNTKSAEIIFASPKIHSTILNDVTPLIKDLNNYFLRKGFDFRIKLIYNEDFYSTVLEPILLVSNNIADTNELFMRAYQMCSMFAKTSQIKKSATSIIDKTTAPTSHTDRYKELKVGQIARTVLKDILENGNIPDEEIRAMLTFEYSKQTFHLQYPLLAASGTAFEKVRYYSSPIYIKDTRYYLCSQWFEVPQNNDRPYLLKWIENHNPDSFSDNPQPKNNFPTAKKETEDSCCNKTILRHTDPQEYTKVNMQDFFRKIFDKQNYAFNTCNNYAHWLYKVCEKENISSTTELENQIEYLRKEYCRNGTKYYIFEFKDKGSASAAVQAFYNWHHWKDLDKWHI